MKKYVLGAQNQLAVIRSKKTIKVLRASYLELCGPDKTLVWTNIDIYFLISLQETHTRTCAHANMHTYTCMCAYMCACMSACMCVYFCACV